VPSCSILTPCSSQASDASAFLERALKEGRTWDIVIVDPPSYAVSSVLVFHTSCRTVESALTAQLQNLAV
jgi:hypothetical protein